MDDQSESHRPALGVKPILALWLGFVVASVGPLVMGALRPDNNGLGAPSVYFYWVHQGISTGRWPVLDYDWVYPVVALVPMLIPAPLSDALAYGGVFCACMIFLNAITLLVIRDGLPNGYRAAWWWVGFLICLGPTSMSKIDCVATDLATIALVLLAGHVRVAVVLITIAGWIKVVHFAWLLPLVLFVRGRARELIAPAMAVSALTVLIAECLGAGARVFGFVSFQQGRGLQAEAVFATPHSLLRLAGQVANPVANHALITWEYPDRFASSIASVLDVLLAIAVVGSLILIRRAHARVGEADPELVALSLLTVTLVLIVFDKVGSPQFTLWLAAPLVLSFAVMDRPEPLVRSWRFPLVTGLLVAVLTQVIFPWAYPQFLSGSPVFVVVGAVRNVLVVAMLGWAVRALWRCGEIRAVTAQGQADDQMYIP